MEFRILGPPEIYDEVRQRRVRLTSPKQRLLLGALLVRQGTPVATRDLIGELWGHHAPDKAANALQAHVSRLRQQLIDMEPPRASTPRLVARGSGYLLLARPEELDSVQFRSRAERGRRYLDSDPGTACRLLREALSLWRGPALAGSAHGPVCAGLAVRLEEERQQALEDFYDAALRDGRHRRMIGELQELVAAHPARERFRDLLVLALQRSGRRNEARALTEARRGRGPAPVRPAPVTAEQGVDPKGAGAAAQSHELLRLRRQVDRLTSEQDSLRSELARLVSLVERRSVGRGAAADVSGAAHAG
ncbi:AfsR/SARP family transcriptional regulator [Streptomyces sp. NPDC005907]|uniref:AfsR/SARP family transcriptional regulator n=1 Tax=Streptomyces sp. NPDC005907 TaxID=3154571 RepID=UPI0033EB9CA1